MSIEAIAAIGGAAEITHGMDIQAAPKANAFSLISDQLESTDQLIQAADHGVRELAAGEAGDLHRVMLDLEKAKMSLSLVVQVRNRLLESYQEVMRMQL